MSFGDELSENSSTDTSVDLLKRWLYDEVLSSPERTRKNTANRLDDSGKEKEDLFMAASTLNSYQMAAFNLGLPTTA